MVQIKKKWIINSPQGLHARPAALFVKTVSKFKSNVTLSKGDDRVNGKSIMGILTLGAQQNSEIDMEIDGDDAQDLIVELENLFKVENF